MELKEYKAKSKRLEELLKQFTLSGNLDENNQLELDRLSDEIQKFEEKHYPFKVESLNEMIELRMYQRKLKQKDLAQILGTTPSRISEILNGKRKLTMELAKSLYSKLNIDAELILQS